MASFPQTRQRILIIASHQDSPFVEELRAHPALRPWLSLLDIWYDQQIDLNPQWPDTLAALIASARVMLVFASPTLAASVLLSHSVPLPLLEAARQDGAAIRLLILDSSPDSHSLFNTFSGRYNFINSPTEPLRLLSQRERDTIWEILAATIEDDLISRGEAIQAPEIADLEPDEAPIRSADQQTPPTSTSPSTEDASAVRCRNCGAALPAYARFCGKCGQALSSSKDSAEPPQPTSAPQPIEAPAAPSGAASDPGSAYPSYPPIPQPGSYNQTGGYSGNWGAGTSSAPVSPWGQPPTGSPSPYYPPTQASGGWQPSPPYPSPYPIPTQAPPKRAGRGLGGIIAGVKDRLTPRKGGSEAHPQPPAADTRGDTPTETPRFTAFYPKEVTVETWNTLLVYTHVAEALEQVRADALRVAPELAQNRREAPGEALRPVARGTDLTIVPHCQGITFNPPSFAFKWLRDVHRAQFDFLVSRAYAGRAGNGEITIYAGPLIIGTIPLALLFEARPIPSPEPAPTPGQLYQQIFASYSHRDTPVVLACRSAYKSLGWDVLIDMDTLRSGEAWSDALMRMIDRSDVFQLFWSEQAAQSEYVRREWDYALKHGKGQGFIRPVYWELPMFPPPAPLAHLHFAYQPLPRLDVPLSAYDQAIQADPTNPIAYHTKGNALAEQGRYAEALAAYQQAIQLRPNFGRAYRSLGVSLERLGRQTEATQAYEYARQLGERW